MSRALLNPVLLTFILKFTWTAILAQGPECLFVHFDKSFYIAGETIWYKVYQLDTSNTADSRILHVDLVSHENESIAQQKLLFKSGTGYGSITLPIDAKEGYYRFRAFTRYNLNFDPPVIYEANVPVFEPINSDSLSSTQINRNTKPVGAEGIKVAIDRQGYQPRDSLTISFEVTGDFEKSRVGSFSISVVPSDLVIPRFEYYSQLECPNLSPGPDRLLFPEKSLLVEGSLRDPDTKELVSSRLISVYSERTSQLIRATSRGGKIRVTVPDYWGSGVFQVVNLDPYNPEVLELIQDDDQEAEIPYYNQSSPRRSARVLNYIDQYNKRRKIVELFDLYTTPEINELESKTMIPDATYRTSDYTQIYSFEDFVNEAINNVRVRTINDDKTIRLFNKEEGDLFQDHPWYLVDGFLTFNEQEVLNIPFQDIVEVRLYSKSSTIRNYFHGFMLRSGIMEVITRDIKYVRELRNSPNVVEVEGFTPEVIFANSLPAIDELNTPDLRGVMYWIPEITTDKEGVAQVKVPLSDDTGKFAIIIMGANNLNRAVVGYKTFDVRME